MGLKKFPESLRHLKNIELISLSDNEIEEFPEWIGELTELKAIEIVNNRLHYLPQQIEKLTKLRFIWLTNNHLESLPIELQNIPIIEISLDGNSHLGLPKSIYSRPTKEILRYYFESQGKYGRPLLELKIILVGRGQSGKTTLVKQLAGEKPDEHEPETHSISIRELTFNCPQGKVRARTWDFGGQEILHSTHQFFLTERSLYLLVLEPRSNLAQRDAEYWLRLIEIQGEGSPVIIALNWSHARPWRIDEVKLKRKFPFIVDFISTDALMGDGIQELQQKITETIEKKMQDVWFNFPVQWRNIKDEVAGMSRNFLTYSQYTELCIRNGEVRPDAQADLAGILHALGLALYFGNDSRLHDTRVLNPGWVTGGVYAIIRSAIVDKNSGQLSLSDMPRILMEAENKNVIKANDYPRETYPFILELMRAFQLCFANEEEKDKVTRYLVPELLPVFEPEMTEKWEKAPVRLRYRYNVLPPGLLPQFIVQTHALSDGALHWRHGVVLRHADVKALIREESDRSEFQVFILGENTDTRSVLVAMVRRELEKLHSVMKMQPVEELELTGENEQWIGVKALREFEQPDLEKQKLPVQPEGTAIVNVTSELNKLIPAETRAIDRSEIRKPAPVKVFVGYAHADERQLKRLDSILAYLEVQYDLAPWRDKRLIAGDNWDEEILRRLEEMDIFLFIASQASLARPYIKNNELMRAQERKKANQIEFVVVKLEPCACDDHPFLGKLQRLASNCKSVAETNPRSIAWENVRKDLLPVIKRVRDKKK